MSNYVQAQKGATLASVQRANDEAWGDGWSEEQQNAVYTHKPPHGPLTKAQTEHVRNVSKAEPHRKTFPGSFAERRMAITEHPANDEATEHQHPSPAKPRSSFGPGRHNAHTMARARRKVTSK